MSAYKEAGFENRDDYLQSLADEYNVEFEVVYNMAQILGEEEDFDGLLSSLEWMC